MRKPTLADAPDAFRSAVMRELLLALRAGPLDIHQLDADLASTPLGLNGELQAAIDVGLVEAVVLETGRSAWALSRRGRDQLRDH